jgi:ribosomal protein S18 acetylase RimI-like enzyme
MSGAAQGFQSDPAHAPPGQEAGSTPGGRLLRRKNVDADCIFSADNLTVRRIRDADLRALLQIYRQCEDFLALGPVSTASIEMVRTDIARSAAENGIYCLIIDSNLGPVGVLDFVPKVKTGAASLSLLMIGKPHRGKGIGTAALQNLESYLVEHYGTSTLDSGVQINNEPGLQFWKKRGFRIETKPISRTDGTTTYDMSKRIGFK